MTRPVFLSPVLLLLVGCLEVDGILGDASPDAEPVEGPRAGDEEQPEEAAEEEADCCSLAISGPGQVVAGEEVVLSVALIDDDGTDLTETAHVTLSVVGPDGEVAAAGMSFVGMAAGAHIATVTAQWADGSVSESVEIGVIAGPVAAIAMSLSAESADPGDTIEASISGWDIAGNPVEPGATLSVSPEDCAAVEGTALVMQTDGVCEVTAQAEGLTVGASVMVDGNGPAIRLVEPGRGGFVSPGTVAIEGTVTDAAAGVASVVVDGQTFADDFALTAELSAGVHTVSVVAVDNDGNAADLSAGFLVGDFIADDTAFPGMWVMTGAERIAALGDSAGESVPPSDIEDAVAAMSPLLDTGVGCEGATVSISDTRVASTGVTMVPDEGVIEAVFTLSDLEVDLSTEVRAEVFGQCFAETVEGQVAVGSVETTMLIALTVDSGEIAAEIIDTDTLVRELHDGGLADLGVDVEGLLVTQVDALVVDGLADSLGDGFEAAVIAETIAFADAEIDLAAVADDVSISPAGIAIEMTTMIESTDAVLPSPGSLSVVTDAPSLSAEGAAISVDTLNRLLHHSWRAGALEQVIPDAQLGLDEAIIGLLFPGAESLSLELSPQLPPVVLDAGGSLSLDMAEVHLVAWGEIAGEEQRLGHLALHLSGALTPAVRGGALQLEVALDDMTVDAVDPEANAVASAEGLEDLIGLFGSSLSSELLGDVSMPLPDALGEVNSVSTDGSGWLVLE